MTPDSAQSSAVIRTRFAPSPTGYLHVGGARTALYSWAFARHFGGQFILRIEDTDLERSTPQAVQAILDGMQWLGLTPDEGPFYQMQRMDRYREVLAQMLAAGTAYHCYASPQELDAMREDQRARGLKPRYDGRWRPDQVARKNLQPPAGVKPVVRFRNPDQGLVTWEDGVKGRISISNEEMDDLIIARADGTPTYNFCVVVDDWDMRISHVIRGDDHINNTPRQINILKALGATIPVYAHLPMIHGPDGEKLSKRHGAVSVMQYHEDGYLPEALLNYLARLGWSHGDDEIFSLAQLQEWFTLESCSKSAAQFDFEKLKWLNNHYLRARSGETLAQQILGRVKEEGFSLNDGPPLGDVCELLKDRAQTLNQLAEEVGMFYRKPAAQSSELAQKMGPGVAAAILHFVGQLPASWDAASLSAAMKTTLAETGLKMPQLAMPLRLMLMGRLETPSIDKVMALLGRERVEGRIRESLQHYPA